MITLNNREFPWHEGLTVQKLLEENDYVYRRIVVKVNGQLIDEADWPQKEIRDGDDVSAMHLMAGG